MRKVDQSTVHYLFKNYYKLFPNSSSIAIANLERFIYYHPSLDIDLKIKPGDLLHTETVTYKAITHKKRVKEHKGNTLFGVSYYAVSQPIIKEEKIIGAMTAIFPQKPQELVTPYVTIRSLDRWMPIHLEEIIFMEAQNRKTYVTSAQCKGTHRYNLTELELILPKTIFIRCHRSYIINLHQIKEIHPDSHSTFILIMSDNSRVPVSQSYAKQLRNTLGF